MQSKPLVACHKCFTSRSDNPWGRVPPIARKRSTPRSDVQSRVLEVRMPVPEESLQCAP